MDYQRPPLLFNGHLETIYPAVFRRVPPESFQQERITTPDNDFLDLDWYKSGNDKLVIVSHGLEGNSQRAYVRGMVRACLQHGYDALAWNYRGCGLNMNKQPRFYHSGATDDLDWVIQHALKQRLYKSLYLVGFSLGGNMTLKYLGEGFSSANAITKAVAISVPVDLDSSCRTLSQPANWFYVNRFLTSLKHKVKCKAAQMKLPIQPDLANIKTLRRFDDEVTGPLHGFKDAADYYARNSAIGFLPKIRCQTLLLNALNDPFLSPECYPSHVNNPLVQTSYPKHGGHVGFVTFNQNALYWSEIQAVRFFAD
jgi:uncharacterized protein